MDGHEIDAVDFGQNVAVVQINRARLDDFKRMAGCQGNGIVRKWFGDGRIGMPPEPCHFGETFAVLSCNFLEKNDFRVIGADPFSRFQKFGCVVETDFNIVGENSGRFVRRRLLRMEAGESRQEQGKQESFHGNLLGVMLND